MKLNRELLEKVYNFRNDEMLVLHTKDNKVLIDKLLDLLDEIGFTWRSGTKLSMDVNGNMQYIYLTRGKVTWDKELARAYDSIFFNYNEVEEFLKYEEEKSVEDNPLLDYALSLLNVSKEELIKMKEENDNKTKVEGMVKKILKTFDDLSYVFEGKCISCDDCPYNNDEFSCKQTIFLCHLMEEGKLIL